MGILKRIIFIVKYTYSRIKGMNGYTTSTLLGNGETITKTFNIKNQLHCEGGPAVQMRHQQEWWHDGKQHRKDGPAVLINKPYYIRMEWWEDGALHRIKKPAIIDSDGIVEYWENGVLIKKIDTSMMG